LLVEQFKNIKKNDYLLLDRAEVGHSTSYVDVLEGLNYMLKQADKDR
jgi:hypothetical protein